MVVTMTMMTTMTTRMKPWSNRGCGAQSVIKRGGDAGREVAIQQTAGAREMVAQRERRQCNNQPAQERHSARRKMAA